MILPVALALLYFQTIIVHTLSHSIPSIKESHNENEIFHLDTAWPDKSVQGLPVFGSSVTFDRNGNILVLHRGYQKSKTSFISEKTVLVIDRKSGKVLKEWGGDELFVKPHGITLAQNGDIFVTDVVMHQIFRFPYDNSTGLWGTEPTLTLGKRFVPGYDEYHFCGPSDVVEVPDSGDFFVADGYCHSRVVKFDTIGRYLLQFGAGSTSSGLFNVTHGLALAKRHQHSASPKNGTDMTVEKKPSMMLLVVDRNNQRVQTFDTVGNYLYEIKLRDLGINATEAMLMSVDVWEGNHKKDGINYDFGHAFLLVGNLSKGENRVVTVGLNEHNYTRISSFRLSKVPDSSTGNKKAKAEEPQIEKPHDIAVSPNGKEIFIIETQQNFVIKKYVRGPLPKPVAKTEHKHAGNGSPDNAKIAVPLLVNLIINLALSLLLL